MENLGKIIIFNVILIFCLTAFIKVRAEQANTQLSLAITGGSLSVSAPANASFTGKSFSFDGQNSLGNSIGNIEAEVARGTEEGWIINVTASDWNSAVGAMDYDGDGSSTGQLSLDIPGIGQVSSLKGADTTGITMGIDDSFDSGTDIIKLLGAESGSGSGRYLITGFKADQFIPGGQPVGSYSTNLTLTIS